MVVVVVMVVGGERERGEKRVGGKVGGEGGHFFNFYFGQFLCVPGTEIGLW